MNIHDGTNIPDDDGVEMSGWREAQIEATHLAGAVIAERAKLMRLGEDWTMEVSDEGGLVLFRLDFHISGAAQSTAGA